MRDGLELKIRDYIEKKDIGKMLGLRSNFDIEFLAQGEYNINYTVGDRDRKYVFRLNTASQLGLENQIEYEFGALKALENSGVTPRPTYVDGDKRELGYGILIMEFLEGRPLDYGTDLDRAASIFGKIHSLEIDRLEETFIVESDILSDRVAEAERWLDDYLKSPVVSIDLKRFFESFLNWARKNSYREEYFKKESWHVINNTEVNSHNFIIGRDKDYLIDWEKPVISDPCQDITQFLADTTTLWKRDCVLTKEQKESFFNSYISSLNTGDKSIRDRVEIYSPYLYLRALSWCAHAWLDYQKPERAIKNMDTFRKIESYLDLDFMKRIIAPFRQCVVKSCKT